ncbi:unnamed protein product [Psylliodes chrysocephalus]|uniref:Uncharacterized protein n=1 Tax=Psylliodes chrysocephalus TaxID=3402493 RepID=A0A9P0DB78_9CUCU|nr:unnamed protein product [Psylliodes chrysocephala]
MPYLKKKRNINPEILLTLSSTITNPYSPNEEGLEVTSEVTLSEIENVEPDFRDDTKKIIVKTPKAKALPSSPSKIQTRISSTKYKKDSIIEQIRLDRKQYQEERLKMEKYRIDQMLEIEKEMLEIRRKRNELLEKRNNLLDY